MAVMGMGSRNPSTSLCQYARASLDSAGGSAMCSLQANIISLPHRVLSSLVRRAHVPSL